MVAILSDTKENPLPILRSEAKPGIWAIQAFTDISAHIMGNPSLGVYVPSHGAGGVALVASLAFPRQFLISEDNCGKKVFGKTMALEALGLLVMLSLDPMRFIGKEVKFYIDNVGTVVAYGKGYSRDEWTTTIVRASRVVAAGLRCSIFVSWERRRSSHGSEVADDLTHNLLGGLSEAELSAYAAGGISGFPVPVLEWMSNPGPDRALGLKMLKWIVMKHPIIKTLRDLSI